MATAQMPRDHGQALPIKGTRVRHEGRVHAAFFAADGTDQRHHKLLTKHLAQRY